MILLPTAGIPASAPPVSGQLEVSPPRTIQRACLSAWVTIPVTSVPLLVSAAWALPVQVAPRSVRPQAAESSCLLDIAFPPMSRADPVVPPAAALVILRNSRGVRRFLREVRQVPG